MQPEKGNPRRTVPLTLFLQAFLIFALGVVVLSIVLLLLSFVSSSETTVGERLAQKEAARVATRLSVDSLDAVRRSMQFVASRLRDTSTFDWWVVAAYLNAAQSLNSHVVAADGIMCAYVNVENSSAAYLLALWPNNTMLMFTKNEICDGRACWNRCVVRGGLMFGSAGCVERATLLREPDVPCLLSPEVMFLTPSVQRVKWTAPRVVTGAGSCTVEFAGRIENTIVAVRFCICSATVFEQLSLHASALLIDVSTGMILASSQNATSIHDNSSFYTHTRILSVGNWDSNLVVVARVEKEKVHSDVEEGSRLMVFVAITCAVAVCVAGALFVHMLTRPFVSLTISMAGGSKPSRNRATVPYIHELTSIQHSIALIRQHILRARSALPQSELNGDFHVESSDAFALSDSIQHCETLASHTVRVNVIYESRHASREICSADFDFVYMEADNETFERLCTECKCACSEDTFEAVNLSYINEADERILLRNTLQLQDLLAAGPSMLRIAMCQKNDPKYGVAVGALLDIVNGLVTIVYTLRLFGREADKTPTVAFLCLYVFALSMNCVIAVAIKRNGNELLLKWLERSSAEAAATLAVSVANTQNMQLMFSCVKWWRLRFNAPEDSRVIQRSITWSMFGFLFSDVTQLMFKSWQLYSSDNVDSFYVIALVTSGFSVAFNLVFKLHATFLWHYVSEDDPLLRASEHTAQEAQLCRKYCALLWCSIEIPGYVRQLQLRAVEYNHFYTYASQSAKLYGGTVLTAHNGEILCAFNVHRRTATAALDAVSCGAFVQHCAEQRRHDVAVAALDGEFTVGLLGSLNNKSLHCFGPFEALGRMIDVARFTKVRMLLTSALLEKITAAVPEAHDAEIVSLNFPTIVQNVELSATVTSRTLAREQFALRPFRISRIYRGLFDFFEPHKPYKGDCVAVLFESDEEVCDMRAAQLSVACGVLHPDRDTMVSKLQEVSLHLRRSLGQGNDGVAFRVATGTALSPERILHLVNVNCVSGATEESI